MQSATSTSTMSPSDTICEKPTPLAAAQSTSEAAMAPDCDKSAISPGAAGIWKKPALSLSGGSIRPSPLGPMMRRRWGRAASSIFCRRPFSFVSPAVMTTAARVPFSPSSLISPGTVTAGVMMTARSGTPGMSPTDAWQRRPASVWYFGLTGQISPSKPPATIFSSTMEPSDRGLFEAPTTATDFGSNAWFRFLIVTVSSFLG